MTKQGEFKHSFRFINEIHGLLLSPEGDVIIHDHMNARLTGSETIHFYDIRGKEFRKFGKVSETSMKIKNALFRPPGPYMTSDSQYIYEADYPDYTIKKYDFSGNLIKKFGMKPKDWRSVLKADLSKMPNPQTATSDLMKQLDDFSKDFDQCSITNWITRLKPGVLLQNISKMSDKYSASKFILHSLEGKVLNSDLCFSKYPDFQEYPITQCLASKPFGFCIYRYSAESFNDYDKEDILEIPLIVFHSIRHFKN